MLGHRARLSKLKAVNFYPIVEVRHKRYRYSLLTRELWLRS